ncbi:MAG TPA: ABC transporter permease [Campylobacterales bacterium]|nr:ABC transporter permease [Campylobacterales bacterium]HIP59009.1 ABC transporter permease [Campylobacterales bacterium]
MPYISISLLVMIVVMSFFGNSIYHVSPYELDKSAILLPPSYEHLMGTDRLGRDVLARMFEGGKVSLSIGVGSAVIASFVGLMVGVSAGFFRGKSDKIIIILIDLFLTFPTFFLLLALISYMSASIWVLVFIISITGWMGMARLIRSESFAIGNKPFIKVLQLGGVSKIKIILKYFTPLLAPIFFISFTFGVGGAILAESGLSFLGIGIMPPQISWGSVLSEGKSVVDIAWWLSFFPGLMIFLVIFCLVNISDYLQRYTNQKDKVI